jgi:threonine dehydrogenase-like Zn-dependent dehydrogenase
MYGARDVRVESVPDSRMVEPTDALLRVTRACICGSDLWPYNQMERDDAGWRMGHEFIGVVEALGADVRAMKTGDLVVAPFAWSDGTCVFCREGLETSCLHGGWWAREGIDGGQAEAVRVPQADGTLVVLRVGEDDALMPSLLTLSDVMGTGHHAALAARVAPGRTTAIVGDGAVGLCGVIAAKRLGAEQVILLGRHPHRIALAAVGRVGVPQHERIPTTFATFYDNISVAGGPAPARAYIEDLLPDVLEGRIEPGRVFDRIVALDEVPDGYRAMNDRESIKVMVKP